MSILFITTAILVLAADLFLTRPSHSFDCDCEYDYR